MSKGDDFIEKIKTIGFGIRPPWVSSNVDIHKLATDADANQKYSEYIESEAKKWTSSGKWAAKEKARKDYIKSQKAEWIKRGATASDREEIMKG